MKKNLHTIEIQSQAAIREYWRRRQAKTIVVIGTGTGASEIMVANKLFEGFRERDLNTALIATTHEGLRFSDKGIDLEDIAGHDIAGTIETEIESVDRLGYHYIIVEGQGALSDQRQSGVALGLLHGVMPEAIILCHQPIINHNGNNRNIDSLESLIRLYEEIVSIFRQTKVVGIGMQSAGLTDEQSVAEEKRLEIRTCLPVIDVCRFGAEKLISAAIEYLHRDELEHCLLTGAK
jgi:uncharacterized NAD-dependent epimerase/dehydratase family protein